MKIDISEKEIVSILAAAFCLRKSKELKYGGTYVSNVKDVDNCLKISFEEAYIVLNDFCNNLIQKKEDREVKE